MIFAMEWTSLRPYVYATAAAGMLIIVGAWIVTHRSSVGSGNGIDTSTWSGSATPLVNPASTNAQQISTASQPDIPLSHPTNATIPEIVTQSASVTALLATNDSFDYNAFIAALSGPSTAIPKTKPNSTTSTSGSALDAYSLIPTGLISTSTPSKSRSADQQALYDYGNEAGAIIQTYEHNHTNQAAVLTDSLKDRYNQDKTDAVVQLAQDLSSVGDQLSKINDVPPQVDALNTALAKSYQDMGAKLTTVPHSPKDSDLIPAINAYNATADVFITKFVALANVFKAYDVTFAPDDQGSVFTFSPVGGL